MGSWWTQKHHLPMGFKRGPTPLPTCSCIFFFFFFLDSLDLYLWGGVNSPPFFLVCVEGRLGD